jgi:hypothetical protein
MVTLLNQLRRTRRNAFMLWDVSEFVRLDATPSKQAASAMAACIVSKRADLKKWPAGAREHITGDRVLEALGQPSASRYVNCRPAIIAQVAIAIGAAQTGTPADVLQQAVDDVIRELREDSLMDMMIALQQVHSSPEIKRALYQVAYARQKVAYTGPADLIRLESFVRQMSEQAGSGFRLLPPYDLVCLELLNEQGDLLVQYVDNSARFSNSLCEQLAFVHEHLSSYTPSQREIISNAVLAALASVGCGLKRSDGSFLAISLVQDIVNVPQLHKLTTHASR